MLVRSKLSTLGVLVGALLLEATAACGSSPTITATSGPTSPILRTPPPAVGDGLVCAAAADRLLGIRDGFDLHEFTHGAARPQSPTIQQALAQYLAAKDSLTRERAAGLIQGQCAAYGFYVTTYQECVRSSPSTNAPTNDIIRGCIDRRTWTVYTQQ